MTHPHPSSSPRWTMTRRHAIGLLITAGVLPAVAGTVTAGPAAAEPVGQLPLPAPLRRTDKPNLRFTAAATITGSRHRVTFQHAQWDGGHTYVRDIEILVDGQWVLATDEDARFDEQWVILTGDNGNAGDYYATMASHWVAFDSLEQLDEQTVELRHLPEGENQLTVRWSLTGDNPELQWQVRAARDGHVVVGYQSVDPTDIDDVDEVLCGSRQHAKVIEGAQSLGAWELFVPASLTQRHREDRPLTTGVFVPADVLAFEHERELGANAQPFGMSLRNDDRSVQPVVFAPQVGDRSSMTAGETRGYAFGVYIGAVSLYEAFADIARNEYDYTDYRRNVYDTSLTDTVHNLVDLIMVELEGDDSEDFIPSWSGWWNRAKGFADLENDRSVRTTVASALMSVYYLTGDDALYQRRARPLIEYHVSRPGHGSTPIAHNPVYGNANLYRIGDISGDASTLVPIYLHGKGQSAGIHALAMQMVRERPPSEARTPLANPLQSYLLTKHPAYRAELLAETKRYIRLHIDKPYTTNEPEAGFGYWYAKAWLELVVIYDLLEDPEILDAAHREALRYITGTQMRPVPDTDVTVPNDPLINVAIDVWPEGTLQPDYPNSTVETETVPAWMVSTTGATFEQLTTFKVAAGRVNPGGGFTWIPVWAAFLLRVAEHTGDDLIRDVAHNLVIGRWTNYPGYYNRQFIANQMRPDFPYTGPAGISNIYYHHMPAQLALTLDYLISEHVTRSGKEIDFPTLFETNYVYFRYSLYGHAPGRFYGEENVWPYLRKGTVELDNPQINWLAGVGNNSLYVSLTNESDRTESVTVQLATEITGLTSGQRIDVEIITANGRRRRPVMRGAVTVTVPAKGIAALVVRDVEISTPWNVTPDLVDRSNRSHHSQDLAPGEDGGLVRGLLLVRPDRSGYDAYVQVDTEEAASMTYRIDDGEDVTTEPKVFPFEWTIPVDDLTRHFTYTVSYGSLTSEPVTLFLPSTVTGIVPDGQLATGEVDCSAVTTPADTPRVTARVRAAADAELSDIVIGLNVPEGWTLTAVGDVPAGVPAGETVAWSYDLLVPADAAPDTYVLGGTAAWNGGEIELEVAEIEVLAPLKVTRFTGSPTVLERPGESTELTVSILNMGPVVRSGALNWTVPPGWQVEGPTTFEVPERSEADYQVTVTAPASVAPGSAHRFSVGVEGSNQLALIVRVAERGAIIDDSSPWPLYSETGSWMPSGLRGWNSTTSRYSVEGLAGGTATWRPDLLDAGLYDVSVWYTTNQDTARRAIYVVHHADGETEFEVDQQQDANGWHLLGRFPFEAGTEGFVRLEVRYPESGYHRVDAAQFLPVLSGDTGPAIDQIAVGDLAAPGGSTTLTAVIRARQDAAVAADCRVRTPAGWTVTPASIAVDLAPGQEQTVEFALGAPADATIGEIHEIAIDIDGATGSGAVSIGEPGTGSVTLVELGSAGYTEAGTWNASGLPGHTGGGTRFTSGNTGAVATWTPGLAESGRFRVSVWFPSHANCTTTASYTVVTAAGPWTTKVNQQTDGNAWRVLTVADLDAATAAVELASYASGTHRSDVARFERLVPAIPG